MLVAGQALPRRLYRPGEAAAIDLEAQKNALSGSVLMARAGRSAWHLARALWPKVRHITVCCGSGDNGGDGAVFAKHAVEAGCIVQVLAPQGAAAASTQAKIAWRQLAAVGQPIEHGCAISSASELVVDAILGIGLSRAPEGEYGGLINAINSTKAKVLSLDVPSGLDAGSGCCPGTAVVADATISFIVAKQGLFTGTGPSHCGRLFCDDLAVPTECMANCESSVGLLQLQDYDQALLPRRHDTHKGSYGQVLVVGGNKGTAGAVWLAAAAAARAGAGLLGIATKAGNTAPLASYPEVMVHEVADAVQLKSLLAEATMCIAGPGLGKDAWARSLMSCILEYDGQLLLDADSLNLLAEEPLYRDNWILTPHPGEAARLLQCDGKMVQRDRFMAAGKLQRQYGGVVVLKGSGSIIADDSGIDVVAGGNPGMACGGMGDALSGVIAALVAQGFAAATAARLGSCLHAAAGDAAAARGGERGMQPTDLLPWLRFLCNPWQQLPLV
ncbi:MAG: NAD(P)H-hydrate dehydratase [Candidatus Porifericomitaceae bacterium WSBS_2022_MAG_OTU9]